MHPPQARAGEAWGFAGFVLQPLHPPSSSRDTDLAPSLANTKLILQNRLPLPQLVVGEPAHARFACFRYWRFQSHTRGLLSSWAVLVTFVAWERAQLTDAVWTMD